MKHKALIVVSLLLAGCAGEAVRGPEQAKTIARSSPCAQMKPIPAPNEEMVSAWLAERRGEKWYAWLPYGPGAQLRGGNGQFTDQFGHMGAWIDAKTGKVVACERNGAE